MWDQNNLIRISNRDSRSSTSPGRPTSVQAASSPIQSCNRQSPTFLATRTGFTEDIFLFDDWILNCPSTGRSLGVGHKAVNSEQIPC